MLKSVPKNICFLFLYLTATLLFLGYYFNPSQTTLNQPKLKFDLNKLTHLPSTALNLSLVNAQDNEPLFEYSENELLILNKHKTSEKCELNTDDFIAISNNVYKPYCKNQKFPLYLLGNRTTCFEKHSDGKLGIMWDSLQHRISSSEFVFVKCSQNAVFPFVFNRYNKDFEEKARVLRNKISMSSKKLNVLVVSFESLARKAAFRNLPRFLSMFKGSDYEFFDFSQYSTVFSSLKKNFLLTLYGKDIDLNRGNKIALRNEVMGMNQRTNYEILNEKDIFAEFRKLGYVTMYLNDWRNIFGLENDIEEVQADHFFCNMWNAARLVFENSPKQQKFCIGNMTNFEIAFDYTNQFFNNYKKSNKFSFIHISHPPSSKFNYEAFDQSLYSFFSNLLSSQHPNLAIFFISHVGEDFHELRFNQRAFYESVNPALFFIGNKKLIDDFGTREVIKNNKGKLLNGEDFYKTLKDLAHYPFVDIRTLNSDSSKKNFIVDEIDEDRNCDDISVLHQNCASNDYYLISLHKNNEAEIVKSFISLIKDYTYNQNQVNKNCKTLNQVTINFAKKFLLSQKKKEYSSLYKISAFESQHSNFTLIGFVTEDYDQDLPNSKIISISKTKIQIGIQTIIGLDSCIT